MHDKCDFWEISYIFRRLEIPLDLKVKLNFRRTEICVWNLLKTYPENGRNLDSTSTSVKVNFVDLNYSAIHRYYQFLS